MIWLLLFLGLGLALAYRGSSLRGALTAYLMLWLLYGVLGDSWALFVLHGLLLGAAFAVLTNAPLRQEWLTRPAMQALRRRWAPLLEHDLAAEPALGWEVALFRGAPNWDALSARPTPHIGAEDQAFLDGPVAALCQLCEQTPPRAGELPASVWAFLKEHRFFALLLPEAYGGLGLSVQTYSAVLQRLASSPAGLGTACAIAGANGLGAAEWVLGVGTAEQKQQLLPRLARGEDIACVVQTVAAGGGAQGRACAELTHGIWQGQRVLGVRVDFEQPNVLLARQASLIVLICELYDPEHLLSERDRLGPIAMWLPVTATGIECVVPPFALQDLPVAAVRARQVFVPLDQVLGGPEQVGRSDAWLREPAVLGRAVATVSLAAGQAAFAALAEGARARLAQAGRFAANDLSPWRELAELAATAYAAQALRPFVAQAADLRERSRLACGLAAQQAQALWENAQMQQLRLFHGPAPAGVGSLATTPVRSAAAAVLPETGLQPREHALFDQLLLRCHPFLRDELAALQEPNAAVALDRFDALLWPHLGHLLRAAARSLVLGISGARWSPAPGDALERGVAQRASRHCANFALLADLALLHRGPGRGQDALGRRLGEVLGALYLISAALRRYQVLGRPVQDRVLLKCVAETQAQCIEQALARAVAHWPSRGWKLLLRVLLWPLGIAAQSPSDLQRQAAAEGLQQPGGLRLRLSEGLEQSPGALLGRLEAALADAEAVAPVEERLRRAWVQGRLRQPNMHKRIDEAYAQGLLGDDEAQQLRACYRQLDALFTSGGLDATAPAGPRAAAAAAVHEGL